MTKFGTEHRHDIYFQQPEWKLLTAINSASIKNVFWKSQNLRNLFVNGFFLKIHVLLPGFPQKCIANSFFHCPRLHLVTSCCVLNNISRSMNMKDSMVTWWEKIVELFLTFPEGFRQIAKALRRSFDIVDLNSQKLCNMRSPKSVKRFRNLGFCH